MKGTWSRGRTSLATVLSAVLFGLAGCNQEEESAGQAAPKEEPPTAVRPEPAEVKPGEDEIAEAKPEAVPEEKPKVEPKPVPEPKTEVVPEPPRERWTLAHAGFASKLPQHTDFYADARKLEGIWKWLRATGATEEVEKFFRGAWATSGIPEEFEKLLNDSLEAVPALFGEEAFVATRGMTWSWETSMGANTWMYHAFGEALASGLASGEGDAFFLMEDLSEGMTKDLGKWIQKKIEGVGGFPKVAIYTGGRVRDERRGEVMNWLKALFAKAAEESVGVKALEFEKSGATWSGFEVSLSSMEGFNEREAPEGFDAGVWGELLQQMSEWSLVVACAEVEDFVVVAVANGQESIELAENPEKSLATTESFKFFEQYDAAAVASTFWASKDLVGALQGGTSYLPFFEGALEGLNDSPLKRRAGLVKSLAEFNRNWKARRGGVAHPWVGTVLVGDEIRMEARGGWLAAGTDLETPLKFAKAFSKLEQAPFIRAHWKKKTEFIERGHKQVEAGIRFLKLVGEEIMEAAAESAEDDGEGDVDKFQRWKRDLTNGLEDIWEGYSEHFSKAFGEESAFVMDLQGEMIPAVGVDEDVLKKGKIPRAALVRPVVKRAALGESWKRWQGAVTNMFGILAEALDQPIPFPDTMTAEKDDLRTYFIPFPFASDDFLPSVSVSDDLYILGSSKTLSEKLYESSLQSKGGEEEAGLRVDVNAEELWDFCAGWLEVYEQRKAAADEFEEDELKHEKEEFAPGAQPGEPKREIEKRKRPADELDDILEQAYELREKGEVEIPQELLDRIGKLQLPEGAPAEELEKLKKRIEKGELGPKPTQQVAPIVPDDESPPEIPQSDENPLPKELLPEGEVPEEPKGERVGGPEGKRIPADAEVEKFQQEVDELLADELEIPQHLAGPVGPFGLLFEGGPEPDTLRAILDKLRWFRGLRYHRRMENGVPHSTLRIEFSAP